MKNFILSLKYAGILCTIYMGDAQFSNSYAEAHINSLANDHKKSNENVHLLNSTNETDKNINKNIQQENQSQKSNEDSLKSEEHQKIEENINHTQTDDKKNSKTQGHEPLSAKSEEMLNTINNNEKNTPEELDKNKELIQKKHEEPKEKFSANEQKEIEKIILNHIQSNPEQIMNAFNAGMKAQQEKIEKEIENNILLHKEEILRNSIILGDFKAPVQFISILDPICPHCYEFIKIASNLIQKRKDINITILFIPILGENSHLLTRRLLAIALQGNEKISQYLHKISEDKINLDNKNLKKVFKELNIDFKKFTADEISSDLEKQITINLNIAQKIKINAVPAVFIENMGKMLMVSPGSIHEYEILADKKKMGEDLVATAPREEKNIDVKDEDNE